MKPVTKGIAFIVAAIVVLVVLAGLLVIQQRASVLPSNVTDISQYEKTLSEFPYMRLADHFPKTIPANAKDVRMDYYPGYMMGGGNFQLKLTLAPEEVEQICTRYSPIAAHCLTSGCPDSQADTSPAPTFYTSDAKDRQFPDSFVVLVLVAESMGDASHPWDHGQTCGLSVDRHRCQLVYWAEWW